MTIISLLALVCLWLQKVTSLLKLKVTLLRVENMRFHAHLKMKTYSKTSPIYESGQTSARVDGA